MAKVTAPLLSMGASGSLGKTLVTSTWKGRPYMRQYVVPANPNTAGQVATRGPFRWLQNVFKLLPAGAIAAWEQYGTNSRFTARNGWTKINLPLIRGDANINDLVPSVAANGGIASGGAAFTAISGGIDVVLTAPTLPTGWSLVQAHACAIEDVDPTAEVMPDIGYATDATAPYEPDVTGLKASTDYRIGAWFEYTKANGETAYGTADLGNVTTLA